MKEERYLQIFLSPSELGPNIKKIIMIKLQEKYLYREIDGELFSYDRDDRVFVIGFDIICEILNTDILPKIKSKNHIKIRLQNIKSTNGCMYFLADGNIILL